MNTAAELKNWSREAIVTLRDNDLWAIVRSTNHLSEKFCNELTWAKAELRRRGFSVA